MAKILHLVLYNETPEYKPMYYHSREWYRHCESLDVETWYYRYNDKLQQPVFDKDNMMLELPGTESYIPGILHKTLAAFRIGVERGFRFLVRSNVSTIVNFPNLLKQYAEVANKDMLYGGPHVMHSSENKDLGSQVFVQGTCMIFAPKVVHILLKHKEELCQTAEDDYSIGALLLKRKIPPQQVGRQHAEYSPFQNINQVTAYRNHDFKSDRKGNISNIRLEVNALVQRYVVLRAPQQVKRVLYFNRDVTNMIRRMCSKNAEWSTSQQNVHLDTQFGDPSPNLNKNLMIYFADDSLAVFTQRCDLTFFCKDANLFVH